MNTPIEYVIFPTVWGEALLAWSEKGVCRLILPGQKRAKMVGELKAGLPLARPGSPKQLSTLISQIQKYFQGEPITFRAKLDLDWATPFQQKVFQTLQKIPYGQTRSYAQVAMAVGQPGASRAVGQANARNQIPLLIPCHRVIAANGSLGGFSAPGGQQTKARLLKLEKSLVT